jgi:hypothetical protein
MHRKFYAISFILTVTSFQLYLLASNDNKPDHFANNFYSEIHSLNDEFNEKITSLIENFNNLSPQSVKLEDEINQLISEFEQKSPLFLLNECREEKCVFNRSINPDLRGKFERIASTKLLKIIEKKEQSLNKKTINYVGFASGKLLGDWFILTKALEKKQPCKIKIHLIDKFFENYFYIVELILKGKNQLNLSDPKTLNAFLCKKRFLQFHENLSKKFPFAEFSLHVYESKNTYLDLNKDDFPDIILSADPDAGAEECCDFIKEMSEKNKNLKSLALLKTYNKGAECFKFKKINPTQKSLQQN